MTRKTSFHQMVSFSSYLYQFSWSFQSVITICSYRNLKPLNLVITEVNAFLYLFCITEISLERVKLSCRSTRHAKLSCTTMADSSSIKRFVDRIKKVPSPIISRNEKRAGGHKVKKVVSLPENLAGFRGDLGTCEEETERRLSEFVHGLFLRAHSISFLFLILNGGGVVDLIIGFALVKCKARQESLLPYPVPDRGR
jgi:hypothetical protein